MSDEPKPSERALRHRAEQLATLDGLEPFAELERETQRKAERLARELTAVLLAGGEVPQRQADYDRGFIDGMAYVFAVVRGAKKKLEKQDAASERRSEPDDDEGDGEW